MKVVYIAGLGRSGSTLLARMLGQEADVVSVGELHHLWQTGAPARSADELCGCGETFAACPFWNAVLDRALAGAPPPGEVLQLRRSVDRIRYLPRMLAASPGGGYGRRLARYRELVRAMYRAVDEVGGGRVVVDASKDLSPLFLLSSIDELEVHVVHLVRDARGVAHSWSRRRVRPEFVDREVLMNRHRPVATAGRWLYSNYLAERAAARHAGYTLLRYEDFVAEPARALARIRRRAGLPPGDLGFLEGRVADLGRDSHTLSGNPMRFRSGPVELELDERWRHAMPLASRLAVTAVAWPQLARYGYLGGR